MAERDIGTIYALKVKGMAEAVYSSLKEGVGRFGWSYVETADLGGLRARLEDKGRDDLNEKERDCYQAFLLDLREDDYVVYINVPACGKCTLARVTGEYFWKFEGDDFNHRFPVDPQSVHTFDRNDREVRPLLNSRLKLRGRKWEISARDEFKSLLDAIESGRVGKGTATEKDRIRLLTERIRPSLADITSKIHDTHPGKALEDFFKVVFQEVEGVVDVKHMKGRADKGADLVLTMEQKEPFTGMAQQKTYVVQIRSFEGEHWKTGAVDDIRRSLDVYQADAGLIVSTATGSGPTFDEALEKLKAESGKDVGVLMGAGLAAFVLKYGADLIGQFL